MGRCIAIWVLPHRTNSVSVLPFSSVTSMSLWDFGRCADIELPFSILEKSAPFPALASLHTRQRVTCLDMLRYLCNVLKEHNNPKP